jgi:NADH dehydrogenase
VLVIGGGFAGGYVARLLRKQGATIVSPDNFMLFTPLLPEAASGTLEPRHTVVPLRQMCPHAELLLGRVTALDEARQTVRVATPDAGEFDVHYEHLVLALGAVSRIFPVPGLVEHGLGFKNLIDAINLRNRVLRELEAADAELDAGEAAAHLSFVFVGAGYAGVEALAELSDLVADALRWYPRLRGVPQRWVLVDAAPKILSEIPMRLGDYAARELARRGVEIKVSTTLSSFDGKEAVLSDGERVRTNTLVWTAGVKANPLLGELGLPLDDRARVRVDSFLRVEGRERVWALGDCAAVPNLATPGRPDPPTSQHALRHRVQRRCHPARRGRTAEPVHRRSRDGTIERLRRIEQPSTAPVSLVGSLKESYAGVRTDQRAALDQPSPHRRPSARAAAACRRGHLLHRRADADFGRLESAPACGRGSRPRPSQPLRGGGRTTRRARGH